MNADDVLPTIQKFGCEWLRQYCASERIPLIRIEGTASQITKLCRQVFGDFEGLFIMTHKPLTGSKEFIADFVAREFGTNFKGQVYGGHYYVRCMKQKYDITDAYTLKLQIPGSNQFCFLYALYLFLSFNAESTIELKKLDYEFNTSFIVKWFQERLAETKSLLPSIRRKMIDNGHLRNNDKLWLDRVNVAFDAVLSEPASFVSDIPVS